MFRILFVAFAVISFNGLAQNRYTSSREGRGLRKNRPTPGPVRRLEGRKATDKHTPDEHYRNQHLRFEHRRHCILVESKGLSV